MSIGESENTAVFVSAMVRYGNDESCKVKLLSKEPDEDYEEFEDLSRKKNVAIIGLLCGHDRTIYEVPIRTLWDFLSPFS